MTGGDMVVGPHVLPQRVTGSVYAYFFSNGLPRPLENVLVAARAWCMHDGTPAHFSRLVRDVLITRYHDKWMGRAGPVAWPPRSPELSPLECYMWRFHFQLKMKIRTRRPGFDAY